MAISTELPEDAADHEADEDTHAEHLGLAARDLVVVVGIREVAADLLERRRLRRGRRNVVARLAQLAFQGKP